MSQVSDAAFALPFPKAVLLDMDGTLTKPRLDFDLIRDDLGIEPGRPILEAVREHDPAERAVLFEKLFVHEDRAARSAELAKGCRELLAWLDATKLPAAVITRNSAASARTIWKTHDLPPLPIYSRDDAPPKPDPTVVQQACKQLNVTPAETWMIGDGVFDIEVARNAGATGVWLSLGRDPRPFDAEPHLTVPGLPELLSQLSLRTSRASHV